MALSTYTELKSSIANFLNRSDLTTEIQDDFIKLVEADMNAKLRIRQMEQNDDVTINAELVTVPTGFIAVRYKKTIVGWAHWNQRIVKNELPGIQGHHTLS